MIFRASAHRRREALLSSTAIFSYAPTVRIIRPRRPGKSHSWRSGFNWRFFHPTRSGLSSSALEVTGASPGSGGAGGGLGGRRSPWVTGKHPRRATRMVCYAILRRRGGRTGAVTRVIESRTEPYLATVHSHSLSSQSRRAHRASPEARRPLSLPQAAAAGLSVLDAIGFHAAASLTRNFAAITTANQFLHDARV
jgi:hypothetical protein